MFKQSLCPCGTAKSPRAKLCRDCFAKNMIGNTRVRDSQVTCPYCKKSFKKNSKHPISTDSINNKHIMPIDSIDECLNKFCNQETL